MKKFLPLVSLCLLLSSCIVNTNTSSSATDKPTSGDITNSEDTSIPQKEMSMIPEVGEVRLMFGCGVAGEDRFYNYCPTVFVEGDSKHVYYCTNKIAGNVTDFVGYRKGVLSDNTIKYSEETSFVVEPGELGSWDSRHACDPSVIKGEFKFHGENYSYLMAYLGCVTSDCTLNETGIAVAKSPQGPWIKCDFKADGTTPINPIVPYSEFSYNDNSWGTGQPSLVSVDKKGRVLLFTTIGAANGTFTNLREYDFSDIDNYQLIRQRNSITQDGIKGTTTGANIINNADFAYDEVNRRVLMIKPRQNFGTDGKEPGFIADTLDVYYIDDTEGSNVGDVLFAGNNTSKTWKVIGEINKTLTGFLRNHNSCIITDPYGHVDANNNNLGIAFTRSDESGGINWTYLSTYRLYETALAFPKKYFN